MIQAILSYQFTLNEREDGDIEPEFKPIELIFNDEQFTSEDYSTLITENDIFAVFYQHTTSVHEISGSYSNFYSGRLKDSPFQVISYFKQLANGAQYMTLSLFSLTDDLGLFENLIHNLAKRVEYLFDSLERAKNTKQLSLLTNINERLENEIKFTIFQVERLFRLDKLQKVALIFSSNERIKILDELREHPISKNRIKELLEEIKENSNLDLMLEPFLELNLVKRDWIKGERDKETGTIKNQGEYLFLTKDIYLIRTPNLELINHLKDSKHELAEKYEQKVVDYFASYDPTKQTMEETKEIALILLEPDLYDTFVLLRSKYYPLEKLPKIFSEFADTQNIIDYLTRINILTLIKDSTERIWVFLLTDIKPLIIFPEYLLPKIRDSYKSKDKETAISHEIAKKAMELLELSYPEKVEF